MSTHIPTYEEWTAWRWFLGHRTRHFGLIACVFPYSKILGARDYDAIWALRDKQQIERNADRARSWAVKTKATT